MDTSIDYQGYCNAPVEMGDINYLWSANQWLADPTIITDENRTAYISNEPRRFIFTWNDINNDGMVDWASDVIDNGGEMLNFEAANINWDGLGVDPSRGEASQDFDLPNDAAVDRVVNWMRGEDDLTNEDVDGDGYFDTGEDINHNGVLDAGEDVDGDGILDLTEADAGNTDIDGDGKLDGNEDVDNDHNFDLPMRSRQIPDGDFSANIITWRLGDIIHSTPMTVAAPQEGYHLIYNDYSYAQFLSKYLDRRHVVYFGSNDGMLHAVNAGFYSVNEKKFCLTELDGNGDCNESSVPASGWPALGAELWAYVPYNLLPHLSCLTDPNYEHKYFIDQRPRIFDMQIFNEEPSCRNAGGDPQFDQAGCIHPNGWGTILVNGMRFGGYPVNATELNGNAADTRKFVSSWFFMDITDPEMEPVMLGELTFKNDGSTVNLGYTTGIPTVAIMKESTGTKWYMVIGSGPTGPDALEGVSDQDARVIVFPLDWLIPGSTTGMQPLQISPDSPTVTGNGSGTYVLQDNLNGTGKTSPNGFVSDMITVDYDINPSYEEYKSDVIYFGTVEGQFATRADGTTYWDGGGKLWRLITKELGAPPYAAWAGKQYSKYGRSMGTENTTSPADWKESVLIDLSQAPFVDTTNPWVPTGSTNVRYPQPITAAPSVGTDGHNFWVYFGTGRFFHPKDKTDYRQQTYYGIKEPAVIIRDSGTGKEYRYLKWYETGINSLGTDFTGNLGLTRVDDILVGQSPTIRTAPLTCQSTGGLDCLPWQLQDPTKANLYALDFYISGVGGTSGGVQKRDETGAILNFAGAAECWKYNGCSDGWYRDFYPYTDRERNVGQATLLGGLVTFTTYQPFNDVCQAEGNAFLYGVYYRTGTAWHKSIFGLRGVNGYGQVEAKVDLGRGLATTPNLHTGGTGKDKGTKAFIQTSTGEIQEIQQENLPLDPYTGPTRWRQCN